MASQKNQWFVPGDGIAREVITADIQRYLGPDAVVRPGQHDGVPGYWITAYRTLTSRMIQDLRSDSQRWQSEKDRGRGGVAYQDSSIHASRQCNGPTTSETPSAYGSSGIPQYTTTPTATYTHGYPTQSHAAHPAQPRTEPAPYYPQHTPYGSTPAPAESYSYAQPDPYGHPHVSSIAAPGYYIASDGRQYPLSQMPQRESPPSGRGRGSEHPNPQTSGQSLPSTNDREKLGDKMHHEEGYSGHEVLSKNLDISDPQFQSTYTRKKQSLASARTPRDGDGSVENWLDVIKRSPDNTRRKTATPHGHDLDPSDDVTQGAQHMDSETARSPILKTENDGVKSPILDDSYGNHYDTMFELAYILEKFVLGQFTEQVRSDFLPEETETSDAHGGPNRGERSGSFRGTLGKGNGGSSKRKRSQKEGGLPNQDQNQGEDDESSDDDAKPPRKRAGPSTRSSQTRRLRCFFHCHDGEKYSGHSCSGAAGFPDMPRLRFHVMRKHVEMPTTRCPRCQDVFDSNNSLTTHLNADERCPRRSPIVGDLVPSDQWAAIDNGKPKGYRSFSVEEKWLYYYKAFFPDDGRFISPYASPIMIDRLQRPLHAAIEEVLTKECQPAIRAAFEHFIDVVKEVMPEILRRTQEKVDSNNGLRTPESSGSDTVLKTPKRVGKAAVREVLDAPAPEASQLQDVEDNVFLEARTGIQPLNGILVENRLDQQVISRPLPGTTELCLQDGSVNMTSLGGMFDFDMEFGDCNAHWDDSYVGSIPQATIIGLNDSAWGSDTLNKRAS